MVEAEKEKFLSGDPSHDFHFCNRIRNLSGKSKNRSPALSRSPSLSSLSRSTSSNTMPGLTDIFSRTSSWAHKLSSFLINRRSHSGESSDSGFHSLKSFDHLNSNTTSRRSSTNTVNSERSESEDELLTHVNVFPGVDVNEYYNLKEMLGDGAFSKVYLAESKREAGGFAAVKIIDKDELCKDEDKMFLVDKEIEIMSQLDHPNIVRLYEVYESKSEVCLVMELAKGGELFDKLLEQGCLPEHEAANIMSQVLEAVLDLHTRRIVHRDLKPENLLFYDNSYNSKVMVVDFGLSEYEDELNKDSPVCGTATYLAPEVIAQTESSRCQDLWSLGVITYIMLCGYPPFFKDSDDKSETKLLRLIVKGKYKFHENFWGHISEDAKHFVSRLMNSDPRLRFNVEEALCHPWLVKNRSWNFGDSGLAIIFKSLMIIVLICAVFAMYFLILSGYFDIQDQLLMRFNQSKECIVSCYDSVYETIETVFSKSLIKLSSFLSLYSSSIFTEL